MPLLTKGRPGRAKLGLAIVLLLAPYPAHAQAPDNVAVVINESSPDSVRVGEYYSRLRDIPATNVLRIKTATDESIERAAYVRTIEVPLAAAIRRQGLQDRILYLVLTRGIPLRIAGTTGLKGTEASVDSELTLLYRRMTGQPVATAAHVENPYFLGQRELSAARRFSHREHDIYLVTRLDAYTVQEAMAVVDRGLSAKPGGTPGGTIVLDQRLSGVGAQSGDEWMQQAAERLKQQGHGERILLDTALTRATTEEPVLGLYSWGSADPENRVRTRGLTFAAGAIAASLTSFDARSLREPPTDWQPSVSSDKAAWFAGSSDTLIGDLIREGVTGVAGQVGEAYVLGAVRPEILFPAYLSGFNLAEAFYLASPTLSWQQVVIGDPLAAPFDRQQLTRAELEEAEDPATLLPGLFSRRRLATAKAVSAGQPDAVVTAIVRAETLIARDKPEAARETLAKASEASPTSTVLLLMLADLDEQASAYDAAIEQYRRVLEIQPTNLIALNNLAYALAVRKNQPAEALPFARKAAALAPRMGTVLDTLGWIEHLLGNHEAAAGLMEQAVKLEPRNAEIRLHAAIIAAAAGRRGESQKQLEEALKLDPSLAERDEVARLRGNK